MNLRRLLMRILHGLRALVSASPPAEDTAWVDAPELAGRLDRGRGPLVIDVRGADEFTGELGHIAGARNIALADLPQRLAELDAAKTEEIVLVCKTQMRSAKAAALLREAGFGRVTVLRGGMVEWGRQHRPVTTSPAGASTR